MASCAGLRTVDESGTGTGTDALLWLAAPAAERQGDAADTLSSGSATSHPHPACVVVAFTLTTTTGHRKLTPTASPPHEALAVTTVTTPRAAAFADLVALPENVIGEILDGELVASPRPAPARALSGSVLGGDISGPFHRRPGGPQGPGGWWILYQPELHLGRHVLVPDFAGWRRERMARCPPTAYFELPPDWVCEIMSPGSRRRDRVQKVTIYGEWAVSWLWLVEPLAKTVEVFARREDAWVLAATAVGDELEARLPPFDAVALDLSRWWEGIAPEQFI